MNCRVDGEMETHLCEEMCLFCKTLRYWVLYFVSDFFFLIWIWEKNMLPQKRGTLSKNLATKCLKKQVSFNNATPGVSLLSFPLLFPKQKRLKPTDPVEKSFHVRVGVELKAGQELVREPAKVTVIKISQVFSKGVQSQIVSVHLHGLSLLPLSSHTK